MSFSSTETISFHTYRYTQPLALEAGGELPEFELAYTIWGKPAPDGSNVVWVLHALTGHPDVRLWWGELFGEDKLYDPRKWCIICANALGGCYGSTGALSINPYKGTPYYHTFPMLTNRDIVNAFRLLASHLGLKRVHTLIGSSMGGQQALEWAIADPGFAQHLVVIATNAWHSPWGIAWNEAQRMSITADATWHRDTPDAGLSGMRAARATAMLSYRSYDGYGLKQSKLSPAQLEAFAASGYQRYQGAKLAQRFTAFTYWAYSQAMDSHDVRRGLPSLDVALGGITARTLVVGINSDILFPPIEQQTLAEHIPNSELVQIDSHYGHDGFLTETETLSTCIQTFYQKQALPVPS